MPIHLVQRGIDRQACFVDDGWSGHRDNLGGAPDGGLTAQASYLALGPDRTARAAAQCAFFAESLAAETTDHSRIATATNAAFATHRFQQQIEAMRGRRVVPLPSGRPR